LFADVLLRVVGPHLVGSTASAFDGRQLAAVLGVGATLVAFVSRREAVVVTTAAAVGEFAADAIVGIVVKHDRVAGAIPSLLGFLAVDRIEARRAPWG